MSTIETSPDIKDIAAALFQFQGNVEGVHKSSRNPAFKTKYANLETVIDTIRPGLQAAGLVFLQAPGLVQDGKLSLTTRLMHPASGQWIQSTMQAPLPKSDPQAVGSATTYLSRYSLMAILGVPPTEDDDAQAAMPDRNAQQRPYNGPARLHTNGKPIVLSASQETSGAMLEALWKISGDKVDRWLGMDAVKRDLAELDQVDRERVEALAEERRAIR